MAKESLNSDRINYMIWRYLQECNYSETASKLQKEWNVEDPTQLEFAPHVRQNALVAVLNRGLLYGATERNTIQSRGGVAAPAFGFFGPLNRLSPPPGIDEEEHENVRKRELDERPAEIQQNGSLAKRPRLSNGHENGVEPTPMEIDDIPNGNGHAYPSPKEVERPPTPIITDGPETGTQVDKVTELGSETTFLTLSDPENTDLKPYVLYTAWNPRDPTILVGAGTDKLARLWKISRGAAANDDSHVNYASTPYHDLVDRNFTARNPDCTSTTTAAAWTSDGAAIALASEWLDEFAVADRDSARVTLWGSDGSLIQEFAGFDPPIVCLQWNPSNTLLLALMLDGNTSLITIFQPTNQSTLQFPLPEHTMDMQPLEAVWTGEHEFVVCGGDLLCAFSCSDSAIVRTRKFETREDHRLIKAMYDRHSRLLATASESGVIDIWDQQGQCYSRPAHEGMVTSLSWQPVPGNLELDINAERFLASSGEDGIINIWSSRPDSKPKVSMTMDGTVVAMAFTPDGAFLAGATTRQILIWRLEDTTVPRARWIPELEQSWRERNDSMSATEEDQHTLSWDANGHKLAYGINNNLAVIEWRPIVNGIGP